MKCVELIFALSSKKEEEKKRGKLKSLADRRQRSIILF